MKEAQQNRVDTAWLHSYNHLVNAEQYIVTESRSIVSRGRHGEGGITKGHDQNFVGDGYVHYLDYNDFLGVYICRNILNCTL